jgi:hypothetical protein
LLTGRQRHAAARASCRGAGLIENVRFEEKQTRAAKGGFWSILLKNSKLAVGNFPAA